MKSVQTSLTFQDRWVSCCN